MRKEIEAELVSIGLPTFNRPEHLELALNSLINQTWRNIEIIISDNASTDTKVVSIIERFMASDDRIRLYSQIKNIGASANFFFVLNKSKGSYFMWAADDDIRSPWFIERCMLKFKTDNSLALVTTETIYITPDRKELPFFPEGKGFLNQNPTEPAIRILEMIKHNYGNLIYGLFRKDALFKNGRIFWEMCHNESLNEIPPLIYAAYCGGTFIYPEIGLYKMAPEAVYYQAYWEVNGGALPRSSRVSSLKSARDTWNYHEKALGAITASINLIGLDKINKNKLIKSARKLIYIHYLQILTGYKPHKAMTPG